MTSDVTDMSTPVTRGELRDELAQLERRIDGKFDLWGGALLARIVESEKRVLNELARHTQAVLESMTRQIVRSCPAISASMARAFVPQ